MAFPPAAELYVDPAIRARVTDEVRAWSAGTSCRTDPELALEYFRRFYHAPLSGFLDLATADASECASGFGFAALAFVLAGGRSVVGYDRTPARVAYANELAQRLGLGDRARFVEGDIHELPPRPVDVFISLQTLEHVPRPKDALRAMADRARRALVLSTPNGWWPVDGHDTGLPFAHWLPRNARKRYAEALSAPTHQLCTFVTPRDLEATLPDFRRATRAYNFESLAAWLAEFPCYFPYGASGGRWLEARSHRRRWRWASRVASFAPRAAHDFAPMLEGIYLRVDEA